MIDLSVIMTAKNDNYGGVYLLPGDDNGIPLATPQKERMKWSLETLLYALSDINFELILVEWNPPKNIESIASWEFMKKPNFRIIQVPQEVSEEVLGDLPFHEYYAKNVGIRRARGEYILCTNPDILWLHKFTKDILQSPMLADRWNIHSRGSLLGLINSDIDTIRNFCRAPENIIAKTKDANGDFTLMSKKEWYELNGYTIVLDGVAGTDMWMIHRARTRYGRMYTLPFPVYHISHPGRRQGSSYGRTIIDDNWGLPEYNFEEINYETS